MRSFTSRAWCRAVVLCFAVTLLSSVASGADEQRPNVIVFIGDDIGWNDFGCYGNACAWTPNVDRLAADGLRFTRAYLTASSCSPSRSSIITGRYPHNTGKAAELHREIASNLPWFPELLREAGYYTAIVGKHHMKSAAPAPGQTKRPTAFDLVDPGNIPGNRGGHGKWVGTVLNRPADRPFFFWFAAYDAHRNWDADADWDARQYGPRHTSDAVVVPPFLSDDSETRQDLASYYNEITRFDFFIGEVICALEAQGQLDDTLILVLADNGRPFPRAKTRLHDSGMKTALVAHWPNGISAGGQKCDSLVSVIDLAPTILNVAGVIPPESFQGVSLEPLFGDPSASVRNYAFSEHNWHDYEAHGRSVRTGDMLLIRNFRPQFAWQGPADSVRSPSHLRLKVIRDDGTLTPAQADVFLAPRPQLELYDVKADPDQLSNLADNPVFAANRTRLSAVLDQWVDETGDSVPTAISSDLFDRDTGEKLAGRGDWYRGITPGEDRDAARIMRPGPR